MGQAFHGFDATGLSEWMYDTRKTSLQVKESYLEQKIAFEDLMRSYEDGSISAEQFASAARKASDEMELLNQQDMDKLNRALEQAERQMQSLQTAPALPLKVCKTNSTGWMATPQPLNADDLKLATGSWKRNSNKPGPKATVPQQPTCRKPCY